MTRAYLRLDTMFDERKSHYPDGPYATFIACLCLGESQPHRGRFRSLRYLKSLLDKRGRHVQYLIDHDDLKILPDQRIYIDGWDEWQEGDWKVTERVQRARNRHNAGVTPDVTVPVTPDVTVATDASRLEGLSISGRQGLSISGGIDNARAGLPNITPAVQEAGEGITGAGILSAGEKQLTEIDRLVERFGSDAVVGAFRRVANGEVKSWRQLVWDSVKVLEPFANGSPKAQREQDEAAAAKERSDREYRATQERIKADPLYQKLRGEA